MSSVVTIDDLTAVDLSLICRGCLATSGHMKNMIEWGLVDDFYNLTNVQVNNADNPSLLLCVNCEDVLFKFRTFKVACQQSDVWFKTVIEKRASKDLINKVADDIPSDTKDNVVHTEFDDNRLIVKVVAYNMHAKIHLPCPYGCQSNFMKRNDLLYHLIKHHNTNKDCGVDLKFYCPIPECAYHIGSGDGKYFTGRKYLNQHTHKMHREKIKCDECGMMCSNEVDYKRHLKTCNYLYVCQECDVEFNTNEKLLVHLLRKHPQLHKQYKNERKAEKRRLKVGNEAKKAKIDSDKAYIFCDSPKRSFATQTLDLERHIKNDVTLTSWQADRQDETKKDETSTQTVFEDVLSLKSNLSEDYTIFSDAVSLSDIQTQTVSLEFGLSRSNKETITSETQSPDFSIKETQTCFCLYDSPKGNLRCSESVASSPCNTFSALTSTETQTLDLRRSLYNDVFSSFTSAETQTCFEEL